MKNIYATRKGAKPVKVGTALVNDEGVVQRVYGTPSPSLLLSQGFTHTITSGSKPYPIKG